MCSGFCYGKRFTISPCIASKNEEIEKGVCNRCSSCIIEGKSRPMRVLNRYAEYKIDLRGTDERHW